MNFKRLVESFKYAFRGLGAGFKGQQNIWIQLACAVLVLAAAVFLGLDVLRMGVLLLVIGFVLTVEIVNTAVEQLLDRLHPKRDPAIGRIKDLMAGAVLLCALIAIAVGVLVFFGPVKDLLGRLFR